MKKATKTFLALLIVVQMLTSILLTGFSPFSVAAVGAPSLELKSSGTPQEAFTAITLSTSGAVSNKAFSLKLDAQFDSVDETSYIGKKFADFVAGGGQTFEDFNSASDKTLDDYDAYLNTQSDATFPTIGFSFTIGGTAVEMPAVITGDFILISQKRKIGTYSITNVGGKITVSATFLKSIYQYVNVAAGCTLSFTSAKDCIDGEPPTLEPGGGEYVAKIVLPIKPELPPTPEESGYTLTKTAASEVTAPYINYTINAAATKPGQTLAGQTLADKAPDGMELDSARVAYDGITFTEIFPKEPEITQDGYTVDADGTFKYTFRQDTADETKTSAEITLKYRLNPAKFTEFIALTKETTWTFKNTARLLDGVDPLKELAKSAEVSTNMRLPAFFTKGGEEVSVGSRDLHWTITGQTYFSSQVDKFYVVDTIPDAKTHDYDMATFKIQKDAEPAAAMTAPTEITDVAVLAANGKAYADLTIANLNVLTTDGTKPVFYKLGDAKIVILPIDEQYLNGKLTITYTTNIQTAGAGDAGKKDMVNKARVLWQWKTGSGYGGIDPKSEVSFDKKVVANYTLVEKTAGGYVQGTQLLNWNFDVNRYGAEVTTITITDMIDPTKMSFDDTKSIVVAPYNRSTGASAGAATTLTKDNGYTYGADGTLAITLTGLSPDNHYTFTVPTTVVDAAALNRQGSGSESNKATFTATIAGTTPAVTGESSTSQGIQNTLITKSIVGKYDYTNHTVAWSVTVNPNHITLVSPVMTDTLPAGTTYVDGSLTVTKTPKGGAASSVTIGAPTEGGTAGTNETQAFALDNGTTDAKYVLEFKTQLTDAFRLEKFKTKQTVSLLNTAKLTGKVKGGGTAADVDIDASASATATHTVTIAPVTKSGAYNPSGSYGGASGIALTNWRVELNPDAIDMGGVTIEDEFKPFYDLAPETVKIVTATVDAAGKLTETSTEVKDGITATDRHLTFVIPDANKTTPMIMTFTTLQIDSANAADMTNEIKFKYGSGTENSTGGVKAEGAQTFDFGAYASASNSPNIQVWKSSANSVVANGKPKYTLDGVTFTLTAMIKSGETWLTDTSIPPKAKTIAAGANSPRVNFLFLKTDRLYMIQETAAPAGYTASGPMYAVIDTKNKTAADFPANTTIFPSTGQHLLDVPNTPNGTVEFTKQTDDKVPKPIAGAEFTLTATGGNAGKLKDQIETSGPDGKVAFAHVDEGTYSLTETPLDGNKYIAEGPWTVTVTRNGGTYSTTITGAGASSDGKFITNKRVRGTVSISKVDDATRPKNLSGAEFTVYLDGTGTAVAYLRDNNNGQYTLTDTNKAGNVLAVAETDAPQSPYLDKGKLLAGSYYAVETTTPDGFFADLDANGKLLKHAFSITREKPTPKVGNSADGKTFENKRAVVDVTIAKKLEGADGTVSTVGGAGFEFTLTGTNFWNESVTLKAVTNASGNAVFENVPLNKAGTEYSIVEKSAISESDPKYKYNITIDPVAKLSISLDNKTNAMTVTSVSTNTHNTLNGKTLIVVNMLKRSNIEGIDREKGSEIPLQNAEIGIFQKGTTVFTKDNAFNGIVVKSDKDGKFQFPNVPYGEYVIAQVTPPGGYFLNTETKYDVKVTSHGATITDDSGNATKIVIENTRIPNQPSGSLVIDVTIDGTPLPGVQVVVTGPNGYNQTFTTDSSGRITISVIGEGDYTVKLADTQEVLKDITIPPQQGVKVPEKGAYVAIEVSRETYKAVVEVKDESGKFVSGTDLSVLNKAGNTVRKLTSTDTGTVLLLETGEYRVHVDNAPKKYMLPESDTKFKVVAKKNALVTVILKENEQETPIEPDEPTTLPTEIPNEPPKPTDSSTDSDTVVDLGEQAVPGSGEAPGEHGDGGSIETGISGSESGVGGSDGGGISGGAGIDDTIPKAGTDNTVMLVLLIAAVASCFAIVFCLKKLKK